MKNQVVKLIGIWAVVIFVIWLVSNINVVESPQDRMEREQEYYNDDRKGNSKFQQ